MTTTDEVTAALRQLQQQMHVMHAENQELRAEILAIKQEKTTTTGTRPTLNQKAGKVSDFSGKPEEWSDWAFRFKSHVKAIQPGPEDVMEWAAKKMAEIELDDVKAYRADAEEISEVMYFLITRHTYGEALEIAKTVPGTNGAEMWRRICRRYDPGTSIRKAALLNSII